MNAIPNGTRVQHVVARKRGVVHAQCTDPALVLVRYGRDTRPTVVPVADLLVIAVATQRRKSP